MLVTLDSITTKITKGTTPTSIGCHFENSGVNFIKSESLGNSKNLDRSKFAFISEQTHEKLKRSQIEKNDILFSMAGMFLGKTGIVTAELVPANTNQAVAIIRIDHAKANYEYVYYYLNQRAIVQEVNASSAQSAQPNINLKQIGQIRIDLPDRKTQNRIVSVLSAIDAKIETNNQINDNLQQQIDALFKAWFIDFLPCGGTAPSNWRYVDFCEFIFPRTEKSDDPALPMFSVTDTGIHPREEKFKKALSMTNAKSKVVYETDLVFGMSREILNWGVMRYPIGGVSSAYNVYSVSKAVNSFYLETYMKLRSSYFKDLIKPASREGQGIDKNALMKKQLLLPPSNVLRDYYQLENALTRRIAAVQAENDCLVRLRDELLPHLMAGEIDVSDIDA